MNDAAPQRQWERLLGFLTGYRAVWLLDIGLEAASSAPWPRPARAGRPRRGRPAAYREAPIYRLLAGVELHEAIVGCGAITTGERRALLEDAGSATCAWPTSHRRVVLAGQVEAGARAPHDHGPARRSARAPRLAG